MEMERNKRREKIGKIVSKKTDKTAIAIVERIVQHPIYKKYIKKHTRYMIHDENNDCLEGDRVKIMETRPISKMKRWRLVSILSRQK
jgi:small subunit ribosomal protein S17